MIFEIALQLGVSVLLGSIIGVEREYRSKAAGFRTIALITLGSCLFTVLSYKMGTANSHDRIAANIITGIGFIGAGVIFKDGFSVSGLTTASSIWVAAAIGMTVGMGEYFIAVTASVLAIVVLALFETIQDKIESIHQVRTLRIVLFPDYAKGKSLVEARLKELGLGFKIKKLLKGQDEISFFYQIAGNSHTMESFTDYLINLPDIKSFDE
jgi:putative Mg2+ transporter-C (MgtC) family protein